MFLACAAKSNAVYKAFGEAMQDAKTLGSLDVPLHLRNAPTKLMKSLGYGKDYRYAARRAGCLRGTGRTTFPTGGTASVLPARASGHGNQDCRSAGPAKEIARDSGSAEPGSGDNTLGVSSTRLVRSIAMPSSCSTPNSSAPTPTPLPRTSRNAVSSSTWLS